MHRLDSVLIGSGILSLLSMEYLYETCFIKLGFVRARFLPMHEGTVLSETQGYFMLTGKEDRIYRLKFEVTILQCYQSQSRKKRQ